MAEAQFTVATFGDRWAIARGAQRLSIQDTFDLAMAAVVDLADQATVIGEQAVILVHEREGGWREFVYTHEPNHLYPPMPRRSRQG